MIKFLKNYSKKWLGVDALIFLDLIANFINHTGYETIANALGVDSSLVNGVLSLIEVSRFVVLTKGRS
jgi:hypothetical protein